MHTFSPVNLGSTPRSTACLLTLEPYFSQGRQHQVTISAMLILLCCSSLYTDTLTHFRLAL